ncbi:ATP-dependent zinc metalloprotease FTSH 2, chloroplastic [Gossypium arboreum]|uniref:ATP-dependent zinc metalloprotease FTSH 2, chloroplastic n=1 Tax=Gossypium arboreum TaxID=29729 RepID=A0A0B0MY75_GOSAR|nr:ATP-dependent zinc metalloprotease FTSH 2, chloroplastic [Gossypium arboreum]
MCASVRPFLGHGIDHDMRASVRPCLEHDINDVVRASVRPCLGHGIGIEMRASYHQARIEDQGTSEALITLSPEALCLVSLATRVGPYDGCDIHFVGASKGGKKAW